MVCKRLSDKSFLLLALGQLIDTLTLNLSLLAKILWQLEKNGDKIKKYNSCNQFSFVLD